MAQEWSSSRTLAQPFIEKGLSLGMSGRGILESLRETGIGYRTQDFYADVRRIQGETYYQSRIELLDPSSSIPRSWMRERDWKMGTNFWYVYEAHYYDKDKDEVVSETRSFGSDAYLTIEEALSEAEASTPLADYQPYLQFIGTTMAGGIHKQGTSWGAGT